MVKFLTLKVGEVVYKRSRSIPFGPSAIEITVLEKHADYALVRKGKDQPPERMYRKEIDTLHRTPFPVPGGGRVRQDFGGPSTLRTLSAQQRNAAKRGN